MGYWKQQLIAEQVEEADRVATPMPWHSHAALTRRNIRAASEVTRNAYRSAVRDQLLNFLVGFGLGVALATMTAILIVVTP